MRVRLLIDTTIDDNELADLAEQIADQPVVTIEMPEFGLIGGRFMGAQQVYAENGTG